MTKRMFIFSLLALIVLAGCNMIKPSETYFSTSLDISFQYPIDWEIEENDSGISLSNSHYRLAEINMLNIPVEQKNNWDGDEKEYLENLVSNISSNGQVPYEIEIIQDQALTELTNFPSARVEIIHQHPLLKILPEGQENIEENYEYVGNTTNTSRITVIDLGDKPLVIIENQPSDGWSSKAGREMEQIIQSLSFSQPHEGNQ